MKALSTLAGKLVFFLLAIENALALAVGLAGAMMWISGDTMTGGLPDPGNSFFASWLTFSRRVTITFLLLGGTAWFLGRFQGRLLHRHGDETGDAAPSWLFLVTTILIAHGFLAVIFSQPLLSLVQENIQLLQSWGVWKGLRQGGQFSGLYLVPVLAILMVPCLAALTALAFLVGAATPLSYFSGPEKFSGVLVRSVCLQSAFLLGLFFTLEIFEAGIRIVGEGLRNPADLEMKNQVFSWLTGQTAVFGPLVQRLAWLLPGFFVCAAVVFWKARRGEWRNPEMIMPIPEAMPASDSTPLELSGGFLETDERFKRSSYSLKWKYLSNPFYKVFEIFSDDDKLLFVARMNGFSYVTRTIRVYGAGENAEETLTLKGRRFLRFPNLFELTDCQTNRKMGTFKRSPAGWIILDEAGLQVAAIKKDKTSLGYAKGELVAGRMAICQFTFQNILKPILTLHFSEDSARAFDRKLGIGLALVICFQAVAFNR